MVHLPECLLHDLLAWCHLDKNENDLALFFFFGGGGNSPRKWGASLTEHFLSGATLFSFFHRRFTMYITVRSKLRTF